MWKFTKRWLYFFHRWLGVVTCLLCVMWFVSGLVMLYVPFPSWSDAERIASLPPVAVGHVSVTPDEAIARAGITKMPSTFRLEMLASEPVYRIVPGEKRISISASTGDVIGSVGTDKAKRHVASTFPGSQPELLEEVDYDQWTVTRRFDPHRPLFKFVLGDAAGTNVYVSSRTGEIVQNATRAERVWNWLGAIPHWIYFSPIRKDQELWRQAVMWLSGPLIIGAVAGLWIGVLRLRVRRPYARGRMTPYRGWMKWHHVGGLVGGVFLTAWIASGWLSVNPFKWFARTQLTETQLAAYAGWSGNMSYGVTKEALAALGMREATDISFVSVAGRPLIVARSLAGGALADPTTGSPVTLDDDALVQAARRVYPTVSMVDAHRLSEETLYWYSHHNKRPLPVIKVTFGDPSATWLYLDPATGAIAGLSDRSSRTYRWLFNFVHDYDLPVLLRNQPARDIIVWLLSLAGLVISMSGVVIGYRTLAR
jgi:uncharacterized iron-regulated membrane protein